MLVSHLPDLLVNLSQLMIEFQAGKNLFHVTACETKDKKLILEPSLDSVIISSPAISSQWFKRKKKKKIGPLARNCWIRKMTNRLQHQPPCFFHVAADQQ